MSKIDDDAYKYFGVTEEEITVMAEKLDISGKPSFESLTKVLESDASEGMKRFVCYSLGMVTGQLDIINAVNKGILVL